MGASTEQVVAGGGWNETEFAHAPPGRRGEPNRYRASLLTRAVESEVIPRLVMAHRVVVQPVPLMWVPGESEVSEMTGLVLANDVAAQTDLMERMRARGTQAESLYLDLLAPAARRLGEMWQQDLCDFTEVTVGVWRLQTIMREQARAFAPPQELVALGRRVLLLPVPGEQHTFGLAVLSECFHRAGWHVSAGLFANNSEFATALRHERFDVVGISTGCVERLETMATSVRSARRASSNPALAIMVGGAVFTEHPELARAVGADATAADGRQAVARAEVLLTLPHESSRPGAMRG